MTSNLVLKCSLKLLVSLFQEEEEEEEEKKEEEELPAPEEDKEYWKRVLGPAYEEHRLRILQEEEAIAATLGKGKRQRRQVSRYTVSSFIEKQH